MKNPLSIGSILEGGKLMRRRSGRLVDLYKIQKAWKEAVGEVLAEKTLPIRLQKSCLIVAAENPTWSHHLSMMKEQLLTTILERTGMKFSDIRFVNEDLPDPSALTSVQEKPEKVDIPLPEEGSLKDIADPELNRTLTRVKALLDHHRKNSPR